MEGVEQMKQEGKACWVAGGLGIELMSVYMYLYI